MGVTAAETRRHLHEEKVSGMEKRVVHAGHKALDRSRASEFGEEVSGWRDHGAAGMWDGVRRCAAANANGREPKMGRLPGEQPPLRPSAHTTLVSAAISWFASSLEGNLHLHETRRFVDPALSGLSDQLLGRWPSASSPRSP